MAITLDPATFVLSIPQADLTLISGTIYKADTEAIRLELKALEANYRNMGFPKMLNHNTTVTLFGVTYARTIEILPPYSITFTPDAQWSVRLDGSNNNYGDVAAGILNQNQVQVIPTNSAGLQDLSTLLAAAYQGIVVINTVTGTAGTTTPIGTYLQPSNNMIDANTIADDNGITSFVLGSNITITEDLNDGDAHSFTGTSPYIVMTADPGADLTGVALNYLSIVGQLDGLNVIRECSIQAVTAVSGFVEKCAFLSTMSISDDILIMECYSSVPGSGYPIITGLATKTIEIRDWHGSVGLAGIVDGSHTIGGSGGRCVLEASCTGGTVHVRGSFFEIVDNSGVGCTILDERGTASLDPNEVAAAIWDADTADHVIVDTMGKKQGESAGGSDVDAIWDEPTANHTIPGSMGQAQIDAGGAGNPWSSTLAGNNVQGTFGYLLQTTFVGNFATIINRLATAGATTIRKITGQQPNQT